MRRRRRGGVVGLRRADEGRCMLGVCRSIEGADVRGHDGAVTR